MAKVQELLAHNLSLLLSERNISQKQLAADMGVSDGAVAHWVKGDNAPSIQRVVDICIKYGVSFDKMFFTYMDTTVKDAKKSSLSIIMSYLTLMHKKRLLIFLML